MKYDREYKELEDKYSVLLNNYSVLEKDFEQYKKESVKWDVEDFTHYNSHGRCSITGERAQEALESMVRNYNPQSIYGISCDTIYEYFIEYSVPNDNNDNDILINRNEDSDILIK